MPIAAKVLLALMLCALALRPAHAKTPATEDQRIEYLIGSVEQLSNATFIRNGSAYDARAAADHLRRKWSAAGTRVKTAQQFIDLCASKSSISGQPYQIRFSDGTLVTSEAFLRAKLKEMDRRGQ
jgi:hypothetical protein